MLDILIIVVTVQTTFFQTNMCISLFIVNRCIMFATPPPSLSPPPQKKNRTDLLVYTTRNIS